MSEPSLALTSLENEVVHVHDHLTPEKKRSNADTSAVLVAKELAQLRAGQLRLNDQFSEIAERLSRFMEASRTAHTDVNPVDSELVAQMTGAGAACSSVPPDKTENVHRPVTLYRDERIRRLMLQERDLELLLTR